MTRAPTRQLMQRCASRHRLVSQALIGLATTFGVGCTSRDEAQEVKRELAAVQASQSALKEELSALKAAAAKPPAPTPAGPRGPDPAKTYSVPVAGAPARGPADAWVTVVEFADFQCKFCGDGAATMAEVVRAYDKDVRLVFRHNPRSFHRQALPAALATVCAQEQGKFWPLYDIIFANTHELGGTDPQSLGRGKGMMPADLEAHAKKAGVKLDPYRACLASPDAKARVEGDQALALKLGARGTPAFFVNGRFLSGAQPLDRFKQLIDEEMARAKASGTPRADYYAKAVLAAGETSL